MPFPASDVVMTLVRDWVRKGMSRPKFCCPMGSFFLYYHHVTEVVSWFAEVYGIHHGGFDAFYLDGSVG